jgi:hypothetical protein
MKELKVSNRLREVKVFAGNEISSSIPPMLVSNRRSRSDEAQHRSYKTLSRSNVPIGEN